MLTEYIQTALHHANYEILDDDKGYYGEIPECQGVFANADTLEGCRNQLAEVLEDWIAFRLTEGLEIPTIDGRSIRIRKVA